MAKYYGEWSTSTEKPIEGNNKARLIELLKAMANTCRVPGNVCSWTVRDSEGNIVAQGGTTRHGAKYRTT